MDLQELRSEIDVIDEQILKLFIDRMEKCKAVAEYKRENNVPVMQNSREEEIIKFARDNSPEGLEDGSELLFSEMMDISKAIQHRELFCKSAKIMEPKLFLPNLARKIACPGVEGSNTELAVKKLFPGKEIAYHKTFEDTINAVLKGDADFGVIPIQNSTAGNVSETFELMANHNVYIAATTKLEINHCLAARKDTSFMDITRVYSHPQAISQCSDFLRENSLTTHESLNTSLAARKVASTNEPYACICNKHCAEINGLHILNDNISNANKNITRFICIAKDFYATENSKIISVSISIPHKKGSLYRLLTRFAVNGLNLVRIENKPVAGTDFEVIFFCDFEGRFDDLKVCALMDELENESSYFRFLGNYCEIE